MNVFRSVSYWKKCIGALFVTFTWLGMSTIAAAQEPADPKFGCGIDEASQQVINGLRQRGFSDEQIAVSCEDIAWARERIDRLEMAVTLHSMDYNERSIRKFLLRDMTLGDVLLRKYNKKRGKIVGGVFISILGVSAIILGAVVYKERQIGNSFEKLDKLLGVAGVLFGSVAIVGGTILIGSGVKSMKEFLGPRDMWGDLDVTAINEYYRSNYSPTYETESKGNTSSNPSKMQLSILPTVNRTSTGLLLSVRF